ncbi:unnamed protein product [Moneuplotes crassus]|uniref:Uncharacterized protein n=1 Tax=Euplotes crassus TaxID=5936 RepID=A0AAD2D9Z7_EUPCR|nr:unnamed protein product [Moneuplotes crassus]
MKSQLNYFGSIKLFKNAKMIFPSKKPPISKRTLGSTQDMVFTKRDTRSKCVKEEKKVFSWRSDSRNKFYLHKKNKKEKPQKSKNHNKERESSSRRHSHEFTHQQNGAVMSNNLSLSKNWPSTRQKNKSLKFQNNISKRIDLRYYSNKVSRKQSPQHSGNLRLNQSKNSHKSRADLGSCSSNRFNYDSTKIPPQNNFQVKNNSHYSSVKTNLKKNKIIQKRKKNKSNLCSMEEAKKKKRKERDTMNLSKNLSGHSSKVTSMKSSELNLHTRNRVKNTSAMYKFNTENLLKKLLEHKTKSESSQPVQDCIGQGQAGAKPPVIKFPRKRKRKEKSREQKSKINCMGQKNLASERSPVCVSTLNQDNEECKNFKVEFNINEINTKHCRGTLEDHLNDSSSLLKAESGTEDLSELEEFADRNQFNKLLMGDGDSRREVNISVITLRSNE